MSFFFKQKTAYELRISDWSSDVCSSDLQLAPPRHQQERPRRPLPSGQRGVHAEAAGLPAIEHAAQHLARVAMQVDETRIGEDLAQQRDAQRVLRRLLQHPHPGCRRGRAPFAIAQLRQERSEEHTSELQSLMRISYAVFCLKKKNNNKN